MRTSSSLSPLPRGIPGELVTLRLSCIPLFFTLAVSVQHRTRVGVSNLGLTGVALLSNPRKECQKRTNSAELQEMDQTILTPKRFTCRRFLVKCCISKEGIRSLYELDLLTFEVVNHALVVRSAAAPRHDLHTRVRSNTSTLYLT